MPKIYKGKVHIIKRDYKIDAFMHEIDDNLSVEVGMGNNQKNPNLDESMTYIKIKNSGNLGLCFRTSKNDKVSTTYHELGPNENQDAIEIIFTHPNSGAYALEMVHYLQYMLSGYYDNTLLTDETRYIDINRNKKRLY